jgi:hypothetical protein
MKTTALHVAARSELMPPPGCDWAQAAGPLMQEEPVDAAELAALAETEALNRVLELLRRELEI